MLWGLTHRTPFTNQIGVSSLVKQWLSIKYIQTCYKGSGGKDFKNNNVTGVSAMALLFRAFPRSCGQMKAGMTGRFLIEAAWCTVIDGKCSGAKQRSLWLSRWQMGKPMGCDVCQNYEQTLVSFCWLFLVISVISPINFPSASCSSRPWKMGDCISGPMNGPNVSTRIYWYIKFTSSTVSAHSHCAYMHVSNNPYFPTIICTVHWKTSIDIIIYTCVYMYTWYKYSIWSIYICVCVIFLYIHHLQSSKYLRGRSLDVLPSSTSIGPPRRVSKADSWPAKFLVGNSVKNQPKKNKKKTSRRQAEFSELVFSGDILRVNFKVLTKQSWGCTKRDVRNNSVFCCTKVTTPVDFCNCNSNSFRILIQLTGRLQSK